MRLQAGVAASVLERRQLNPYLFTITLGKHIFRMSRDLRRDRPTIMLREAISTTMHRHSRDNLVGSSLVVGNPV
jgi:hypothetical protein